LSAAKVARYTSSSMEADARPVQSISTQFGSNERASAERVIALGLLTVRAIHLSQGAVCLASGWKAYRRPYVALGLLLASGAETTWLARRAWRVRSFSDPYLAWMDTGFGVGGLCVVATTTMPDDRTAWLNWMCPLTLGTTMAATVAIEGKSARAVPALLAGVYLVTVRRNIRSGGSQLATALTNATSYAGFYVAARGFGSRLRNDSNKIELARDETLRERERLAAERQRNHEHRLLHDSALQTLEMIASNETLDVGTMRVHARREATQLRRAISGDTHDSAGLSRAIQDLADEMSRPGWRVELALVDTSVQVPAAISEALLGALREAITNAAKYSGAPLVLVNLTSDAAGVRVIVRDRGVGFDPSDATKGFGLKNSIIDRLSEIGGSVTIDSASGRGAKITLWAPR
jgi:signal transduction histidine kinase